MFMLGPALRDARLRRGLELEEVEEQTRISRRYLRALEEENFELLPGDAYAKAFLRSYADFLGLDAQAFADEYQSRLSEGLHQPALVPPRLPRRRQAFLVSPRRWPLLVGVSVAALVGVLAWQYGGTGSPPKPLSPPTPPPPPAQPAPATPAPQPKPTVTRPPVLTLKAVRGACWVDVHLYTANGTVVYISTLAQSATVRFPLRRPLWIRLGAPSNLLVTIAGKPITGLPTQPGNFLATRTGLRPA